MIKIATVASGIGSPEQALKNIGIPHEISFACEIDKFARQTYLANFKPNLMFEDMTTQTWERTDIFHKEDKLYSDLFVGGIPCQSFSLAGKRLGELDPRGLLFYDFYRYVKNQRPKAFIIENVKGLLSDSAGKTFQNWIDLLGCSLNNQHFMFQHPDSLGYNLHFKVINSKDHGVPQNRERVFLVGIRPDLENSFKFPMGYTLDKRLKDVLEEDVDEKYYLSERELAYIAKPATGGYSDRLTFLNKDTNKVAGCITANHSKGIPYNMIQVGTINSSQDGRVYDIEGISQCLSGGNHNTPKIFVSKEVRTEEAKTERRVTGTNSFRGKEIKFEPSDVMNCLQTSLTNDHLIIVGETTNDRIAGWHENENIIGAHKGDEKRSSISEHIYQKAEGVCNTIQTAHIPKLLGNRIRKLTPLECFRLQGFPDDFKKPVSNSQLYKQAGNTITVNVIQGIINNLLPIIQ